MCASCFSLLLILLTPSMWMVAEGLPLSRQEHGIHQDIIAGADFLAVLMDSSALYEKRAVDSTRPGSSKTPNTTMQKSNYKKSPKPVIRELRYPRSTQSVELPTSTQFPNNVSSKVLANSDQIKFNSSNSEVNSTKQFSAINKTNASLIVSVQISSSEGDSRINKISPDLKITAESKNSEILETSTKISTKSQNASVASEEYPSLVAESSKSEFSVDESEPVTTGTDIDGNTQEYPAKIQTISNSQRFQIKDKLEPYGHHSVIYHDEPTELIRGRSVSYSTVIQSIPKPHAIQINSKDSSDKWVLSNQNFKERQERHIELKKGPNDNKYDDNNKGHKTDLETLNKNSPHEISSLVAETNDYFVTARYESSQNYPKHFSNEKELDWKKSGLGFISESNVRKNSQPTEKYWEVIEKPQERTDTYMRTIVDPKRQRIPVLYGKPEQNYEVDESVSVQSNGRVHGVQANKIQLSGGPVENKSDSNSDNQKVGYVVEGRNYRKYRVEERTSDGFIVGEYGVVSHDDGSLRGVRYTADGTINPRLIYDALMKFLSL